MTADGCVRPTSLNLHRARACVCVRASTTATNDLKREFPHLSFGINGGIGDHHSVLHHLGMLDNAVADGDNGHEAVDQPDGTSVPAVART